MDKLIQSFWSGQASDAEKKALLEKISYPETGWEQRLQQAWDHSLETNEEVSASDEWFKNQLETLQHKIAQRNQEHSAEEAGNIRTITSTRWPIRPAAWQAVAAIFVLATATLFLFIQRPHNNENKIAVLPAKSSPQHKNSFIEEKNNTRISRKVALPDGSTALLEPGAVISYNNNYGAANRQITLTAGIARFHVAASSKAPFNVIAGTTRTTALGTIFRIDISSSHLLKIKLVEGKVKIDGTSQDHFMAKATYLLPGQELNINLLQHTAQLILPAPNRKTAVAAGNTAPDTLAATGTFEFAQQPLNKVFRQLEQRFHTPIRFAEKEMSQRWFTGSFEAADPLDMILTSICNMNSLQFRHDNNSIIIFNK
ncbi:FecR family protein [Filimonas effusa]|uniref:FecR family protein n=1 Tax=Filimonas effusa TaxID=2508721 RepID=A0A4V1M9K4_9BACT|nr:FecR family protein [Filimonas effusa]RXK81458.1 FecR family protein [Filimonas effusa]